MIKINKAYGRKIFSLLEQAQIIKLYEQQLMSMENIAVLYKTNRYVIKLTLLEMGVVLRPHIAQKKQVSGDLLESIIEDYKRLKTATEVAKLHGLTRHFVMKVLKETNTEIQYGGRTPTKIPEELGLPINQVYNISYRKKDLAKLKPSNHSSIN